MTIVTPPPLIDRDRFGRPLVTPPQGGKAVAYTRCTTYVDCIEDKFNLQKWQMRMVALGLASRPDLLLSVQAHKDDNRELDKACEAAKEAAAASAAATTGTALHALTELVDRGQELPVLPAEAKADLEAYRTATADLTAVAIEQFCVQDMLKIGGTPDRVVEYEGQRYIADIKTGSIEYGSLKIAAQLAVYARSQVYDVASRKRTRHGADIERGIIIHLPAGQARCELVWVDLLAGWEAVLVARQVREQRVRKFTDLTKAFDDAEPFTKPVRADRRVLDTPELADPLVEQIRACDTADAVRALWTPSWSDELNEVARQHILTLPAAS